MRRWSLLVCVVCAFNARAEAPAGEATPADPQALAVRLVTAMNVAELSAMGLRKATEQMQRQGMTEKQAACVREVKAEDFAPALAQVAAKELSVAELEEALEFYESPAGRKYTVMTEVKSAETLGIATSKALPDFKSAEYRSVTKFGTTAIFQKLVNENLLTRSATGRRLLQDATVVVMRRCGVGA